LTGKLSAEWIGQYGRLNEQRLDWRVMFDGPRDVASAFDQVQPGTESALSGL
jgi:hypothetical protein